MKVLCKRTYIERLKTISNNKTLPFNVTRWSKNKFYEVEIDDFERECGVYYIVYSETNIKHALKKSQFDKYFIDIDELRDEKIEQILN